MGDFGDSDFQAEPADLGVPDYDANDAPEVDPDDDTPAEVVAAVDDEPEEDDDTPAVGGAPSSSRREAAAEGTIGAPLPPVLITRTGEARVQNPFMSKYEHARLASAMAEAIGANVIDVDPRVIAVSKSMMSDDLAIAALNFKAPGYKFPFRLRRPIGTRYEDLWEVEEMILPHERVTYGLI